MRWSPEFVEVAMPTYRSRTPILALALRRRCCQQSYSQCFEECDERSSILVREVQPEFVAFYRPPHNPESLESCGHIIISEAAPIKPVLEGGNGPTVFERATIPDALERRYLVIACAASRL